MKYLERIDRSFTRVEGWLLIGLLSVMVVLAFLQVVLRNVFQEGFIWGDILLRHIVLWLGFVGASIATSQERHITIDALTRFMTDRFRRGVLALTQLFAAGVCITLANAAITFVGNDLEFGSTVYAEIPAWYSQIIIPVGFSVMAFHFIIRAILNTNVAIGRGEAS